MTVTLPPPRCSHLSARADPGTIHTPERRGVPHELDVGPAAARAAIVSIEFGFQSSGNKLRTRKTSGRPKQRNYPGNRTEPVARASLRVVTTANTIGASDSSSHPDPLSTSPPPSQAILQNERSKRARTRVSASTLPSIRFTRAQGTPPFANTPQTV